MSAATPQPPSKVHKRAYQACIPCRERRVRCDLGSVDHPHQGPCGRCRRERKFCHFSATRGKRKATARPRTSSATPTTEPTKRWSEESNERENSIAADGAPPVMGPVNRDHAGNDGSDKNSVSTANIKREISMHHVMSDDGQHSPPAGGNKTAEKLLQNAAYTTHDALSLLWEAGRHSERVGGADFDLNRAARLVSNNKNNQKENRPSVPLSTQGTANDTPIQPWCDLRFVRTGLFTAEEALDLVNYFHAYLAPFTPICSSSFQDPSMHTMLLEEEPILAVTILMLSSRYMKLSGPGSVSRSFMVHERLWQHLQGMISRMIFGQEQFTGGTHDNGTATDVPVPSNADYALAGSSFGSLRTLGTCEALLLLSEWHPRSLHVPAGDDGDSIMVKDDVRRTRASTAGIGGRIRIDWLEPVWRSDRMCWSMLGNALALAVELGIFDEYDNTTIGARESRRDIWNNPLSSQRAYLVQHLLWVYLTQTSGRLGWKNLTSVSVTDHDASTKHGDTIRCWVGVASLMKRGNELLFPSRERTRDIIQNGEYLALLRLFNPQLRDWQKEFDRAKLSKPMRSILTIEYGYVRVYINSVALQAVVEHGDGDGGDGPAMPVFAMLNPSECNKEYFGEVIAAAKSILHTVVEDLLPDNQLKHIPIRTYSRILAGAMFCLKAIALGAKDNETSGSLSLVERTAEALCSCVVDDVHLSNRFGELLQALASSLRNRVIQMTGSENPTEHVNNNNVFLQRQQAQNVEGGSSEIAVGAPGLYERSTGQILPGNHSIADPEYDGRQGGSMSTTGAETPGFYPMSGAVDQSTLQHDPLISFAGLGPNQLGWSGGQDFFDMLGPLLDVQYEQYR